MITEGFCMDNKSSVMVANEKVPVRTRGRKTLRGTRLYREKREREIGRYANCHAVVRVGTPAGLAMTSSLKARARR